jgi:hypothetical protein
MLIAVGEMENLRRAKGVLYNVPGHIELEIVGHAR